MKLKTILAILCGMVIQTMAHAQSGAWPIKPVRVVVPYAPGSTPDSIARLIFEKVQKITGQAMVVENKPGAAGMIGTDQVAKAAPDGHTLVLAPAGPLATNSLLYKKMPYDPVRDLAPVVLVAETPTILVVSNATPANTGPELLKWMSESTKRINYASSGAGTLGHLSLAYLVSRSNANDIPHAPYAGAPQILAALIADDIQMAALPPLVVAQQVKARKIKAIATIGPNRNATLPELPTLKEQGIDFEPVGWFGIATTAGTSPEVVQTIYKTISAVMKEPELTTAYKTQGLDLVDKGPRAFGDYIADEVKRWKPVIQRYNISLD